MANKHKIAPSVLSADFSRLGDEIKAVAQAGADLIHLDVMDGHFVPNITAGPILVEAARRSTGLPLDAHLMIEHPERYIAAFAQAGAGSISVHVETCPDLPKTLALIRQCGAAPAVAINPATPLATIHGVLDQVKMVLIMTVNPGFGGQAFIPACLDKVAQLRALLDQRGLDVEIEVDGGVKLDNIKSLADAGATVFVAGSAIFKSADYAQTIRDMKCVIAAS